MLAWEGGTTSPPSRRGRGRRRRGRGKARCDDAAAPPLAYKGVVYNEMKGVYSSPDSLMGCTTQQALFPDNTYGVDSGGDPPRSRRHARRVQGRVRNNALPPAPLESENASASALAGFHERFYHPSNARVLLGATICTSGQLLDSYLKDFDATEPDSRSARSASSASRGASSTARARRRGEAAAAAGGDAAAEPKQHMLAVNWLLNEEASERESARERARVHPPPPLLLSLSAENAPALPV